MTHRQIGLIYNAWIRTDGDETDGQEIVAASLKLATIAQKLWATRYGFTP